MCHVIDIAMEVILVKYIIHVSVHRVCVLGSHVQLVSTPWTVAHQVPLSVEFSRREHLSELTFPSPHDMEVGLKRQKSLLQREKNIRNDFMKS